MPPEAERDVADVTGMLAPNSGIGGTLVLK
jgi:hypothetical protein